MPPRTRPPPTTSPAPPAPSLAALLAGTDVLSLHCPLRPETYHLIAATELAMPPGAFLVNTARGGLVDEAALLAALDSGHLAGAALDVFETEPPPADHPLRRHPRLITTAHTAGVTPGSFARMGGDGCRVCRRGAHGPSCAP